MSNNYYLLMSLCICRVYARRGKKKTLDLTELKLQTSVSCPMWVLGTELRSPRRTAVLLTADPSLQPLPFIFRRGKLFVM